MANNYLQFSETLDLRNRAEVIWVDDQLTCIRVYGKREYDEDEPNQPDRNPDYWGFRFLMDLENDDSDDEYDSPGFEWEFCESNVKTGEQRLWVYAEEGGTPSRLAHFIRKFLRRFRPDEYWSMTYAATCSKMRVGEFGGGAVFVTSRSISYENSYSFIEKCISRRNARKQKRGKNGHQAK